MVLYVSPRFRPRRNETLPQILNLPPAALTESVQLNRNRKLPGAGELFRPACIMVHKKGTESRIDGFPFLFAHDNRFITPIRKACFCFCRACFSRGAANREKRFTLY